MVLTQEDLDAISSAVRQNLTPELELIQTQFLYIKEIHQLMGLDSNIPLLVTQNNRIAGNIIQDVVLDSINKSTLITRRSPEFNEGIGSDAIGISFTVG